MKAQKIILFCILLQAISSCDKKDIEVTEYDCEAIVLNNLNTCGIFCNKEVFTLKFVKGEDKIRSIIEYEYNVTDSSYTVLNLPRDLRTIGMTIKLNIRVPKTDEIPACYNFEMPMPLGPTVYIVRAEKK
jgi:hypothetical protein